MRFLLPLALVLHSLTVAAQLYSWKDADGKIHYSDEPPPAKTQARKVAPPPAPSADPAATRKNLAEMEMASRKKQKEAKDSAAKAEKEKADTEERRINCDKAKGNLQSIESGLTRFTTNAKGERVALEGAVRDAELASARKAADEWCK
ncbi:MAG: DUF4124 domain-containing protein [Rhodocyclaceae bacterium]|nr:DUF4124 domain-containing protein [Rhodocyclaceae bacterium]